MTEFGDQELINEFLVESYDNLDQLDQDFVALEMDPSNVEMLSRIFRCIHTIKGTCGFLGLSKLESVAHVGENLLSQLRDGEFTLTPDMTNALLLLVDAVREILGAIERDGGEGDGDYSALIASFETFQGGDAPVGVSAEPAQTAVEPEPVSATAETSDEPSEPDSDAPSTGGIRLGELLVQRGNASPAEIAAALVKQLEGDPRRLGEILVESNIVSPQVLEVIIEEQKRLEPQAVGELLLHSGVINAVDIAQALKSQLEGDTRVVGEILEDQGLVTSDEVADALDTQKQQRDEPQGAPQASTSVVDSTIRVDVDLLDKVMNMVGELVLSRNQILQFSMSQEDVNFNAACQRLNLVTTELQEGVMKTRMQPIGNIWNKFPRIVRDLSRSVGKKIRLEMEGEDTELDKTILEAIKDPLTHIVRNSVDHGVETPAERAACGKSEEGCLTLRAFHEGGQVNIEIADDGGGIDVARVRTKAVEKHVISQEQAVKMTDQEIVNLIFAAGLSTAAEVTNISGRGVGMDVVRTNIEKIGGTVDIVSEDKVGTTLRIKIPLTLAIIPALIVTTGDDRYAIPQVSLLELVRLSGKSDERSIEYIHGSPVYRLRGNLLPLVHLGSQLDIGGSTIKVATGFANHKADVESATESVESAENESSAETESFESDEFSDKSINIVVLQAEGTQFGLVVEQVHDTEEIVVRPLGNQIKNIPLYAGATIMGDGKVALILDVLGLAERSNVLNGKNATDLRDHAAAHSDEATDDKTSILLFETTDEGRMAMMLSEVDRLEEFPADSIETTSSGSFVQYRDTIMPLISVADYLSERRGAPRTDIDDTPQEKIQIVVHTTETATVGFHVGRIIDVVDEAIVETNVGARELIRFTAIVQGKVTEFLDPDALVPMALSETVAGEPVGVEI